MKKIGIILFVFLGCLAFNAVAQTNTQELTENKIVINGETFYLYKVQPSEGLYRISKNFGVTTQEIIKYNPGIENGLKLGQVLKIPVIEGRNSSTTELKRNDNIIYHKVEKGQTLYYISKKYDVTQEEIIKLNPGVEKSLRVGLNLRIPAKKEQKPTTQSTESNDDYIYHVVQPQETLFFLSKKYEVSVKDIIAENPGLESGVIKIGTQLRIPKTSNVTVTHPKEENVQAATAPLLEDEDYIYHELQSGETIYALALKYNVKAPQILKANNISNVSEIPAGYLLRIPKEAPALATIENDAIQTGAPTYIVHHAKKKETLQQIAKRYNVPADSIVALNQDVPAKRWSKLKKNMAIKIPRIEVYESDSTQMIADKQIMPGYNNNEDSLILSQSFLEGCDTTGFKGAINVAFIGPFYLDVNDSINFALETDEFGNSSYVLQQTKKIFPEVNIFREFYFGSLLAIDELKKQGVDVNVYTYDVKRTKDDKFSIQEVLAKPEMKNMDFIFGPAHSDQVADVADFCKENSIRLILPFGKTHDSVIDNPYVFGLFADEKSLYPDVVNYVIEEYKDANFIIVKGDDPSVRQSDLAVSIKKEVYNQRWNYNSQQQYFEVNFDKDGIYGVEQVLSKDKNNVIVITSENKKLFNKLLPNLYYLKSRKKYPISLVGYPEYLRSIGNDLEYIFDLNTLIFCQYYVDYNDEHVNEVLEKYRNWFGAEPTVSHASIGILHPNNGLLGYDATLYFLSAFKKYGAQFERCLDKHEVKTTESDFEFKRENTWGGFSNQNIDFIQYTDDFETELQ